MNRRFDELWEDYLEGDLVPQGLAEVDALLAADELLCRHAADLYEEHRLLGLAHQSRPDVRKDAFARDVLDGIEADADHFAVSLRMRLQPAQARGRLPAWAGYALVAALTLATTLAVRHATHGPATPSGSSMATPGMAPVAVLPATYVATLVRAEQCAWSGGTAPRPGDRLIAGTLVLKAGIALLRFDGGAMVVLTGPAELRLESAGGGTLLGGRASVRAAEEAVGFVLRTPSTNLIDLGTEFAVAVADSGATEVHVLEGEVEWHKDGRSGDEMQVLTQGQARRFASADDGVGQVIPLQARRFEDLLPAPESGAADVGTLQAYEPFDYPFDATRSNERRADGGTGWDGPWYRNSDQSKLELYFPRDSLPGVGSPSPAPGGRLLLPAEAIGKRYRDASMRRLARPIDLDADGVHYLSFLVRKGDSGIGSADQWLRFMLIATQNRAVRLGFGFLSDNHAIIYNAGNNSLSDLRLEPSRTYRFVGKIVTGRDRPDQMFLKVYDADGPADAYEPPQWTLSSRTAHYAARLDVLHIFNGADWPFEVDDVRLGTSWASVTLPLATS